MSIFVRNGELFLCSLKCLSQPLASKWFEQIVNSIDLERANRILIVRRRENNLRHTHLSIRRERRDNIKPVHIRHVYIQKNQVRICELHEIDCLERIRAFAHDLNVAIVLKQLPQLLPR